MTLQQTLAAICPASETACRAAQARWNAIAKPLNGLGLLEKQLCRIAAATGSADIDIRKRALAVFCADNGVVAEGISQSTSEVTAIVANNLCENATSVCRMAAVAGCTVIPVDVGVLEDIGNTGLRKMKPVNGTGNIATGPAMQPETALQAVENGISFALELSRQGYGLLAAGEMGIGNTTTSSAVACVLLGKTPAEVTGRGAGLTSTGLRRKIAVVEQAIAINRPNSADIMDVLSKLGGLDIASMCGFYLGAAVARRPVVLDGFISGVAALCAVRLCPAAAGYMLASHQSAEPAAKLVLAELGLEAPIHAGLHLGEGTGAVALLPLLDMAAAVYSSGKTFSASEMQPYTPLD